MHDYSRHSFLIQQDEYGRIYVEGKRIKLDNFEFE